MYSDLIIEAEIDEKQYKRLVDLVYNFTGDISGEDSVLTTWLGKKKNFYSNMIDFDYQPPMRIDLDKIEKKIDQFGGRHSRIRGQLTESIVREYFEFLQYIVKKGSADDDKRKIDLIAHNGDKVILIQSKAGSIGKSDIAKSLKYMQDYRLEGEKELIFAFVVKSFPADMEFQRVEIELSVKRQVLCISEAAIVQALPQYRHSLS